MAQAMYEYPKGRALGRYRDLEAEFLELQRAGVTEDSIRPDGSLPAAFLEALAAAGRKLTGPPQAVFLWVGGDRQHILSLLNHESPFDFVLPGEPDLPLNPAARILPHGLLQDVLERTSAWKLSLLRMLRSHISGPMFQFQAPPPVPSEEHLTAYPGPAYQEKLAQYGLSPLSLRRKVWKVHSDMYEKACAALGIVFIKAPKEALDEDGNLTRATWNQDSIHTNYVYGRLLLEQMGQALDQIGPPAAKAVP
jgi:hypothetical protein